MARFGWYGLCLIVLIGAAGAQAAPALQVQRVVLSGNGPIEDFVCQKKAVKPAPRPASPEAEVLEMPSAEDLEALRESVPRPGDSGPAPLSILRPVAERLRLAIWGDSHIAAAFFSEELVRLAGIEAGAARPSMLPANFGRAGVRLPMRRHCASEHWRYENAYAVAAAAARPGPGLTNMVATAPGAELALDLRTARGAEAGPLRLFYEGTGAPLRVSLQIDGGPAAEVSLLAESGPAALDILSDAPISQLRLRLLEGNLRLHGLRLTSPVQAPLQLDVFGYPGATMAAWARADIDYLRTWFDPDPYDLALMVFGTNEGNAHPFDASTYRQHLVAAVTKMRQVFPSARCVLVGPGDRGVLVPRARAAKGAARKPLAKAQAKAPARLAATPRNPAALLRYSRVHAEIDAIQQEVAEGAGCAYWSALAAMGGPGSAYAWGKSGLMAPDLTHFTIKGYHQLAQLFAKAAGWGPRSVLAAGLPEGKR